MMTNHLLWFVVLNFQSTVFASVTCIGENGRPVDWFIVYKLPRQRHSTHPYVVNGVGYLYMDNSSYDQFNMPDKAISHNNSVVGSTLQQIYSSSKRRFDDVAFLMYNDKDAGGSEHLSKAHSKGVLGFNAASGFWLIHSVPEFPPFAKDSYSYPKSGERFGQSFLCVTFNMATFNDIGLQLRYNCPDIYDHSLPEAYANYVPNIKKAIDGICLTSEPYSHITGLSSLGDVNYTSFAKSKYFGADLYHELVALFYNTDLLAETWQNGEGKLSSNCTAPTVENIQDLRFMDVLFKETEDHSKWTISKSKELGLVCIGDINRMIAQFKRGGGTLCVTNGDIWETFNKAITKIERCYGNHVEF